MALSGALATLLDVGWRPLLPNQWLFGGQLGTFGVDSLVDTEVLSFFTTTVQRFYWRRAAGHFGGGGLETGVPSFDAAASARKTVAALHDPLLMYALNTVVVGGAAPSLRAQQPGRGADSNFLFHAATYSCGADESPWHRVHGCPCLDQLDDDHGFLEGSKWVAKDPWFCRYPCLWSRGIVPAILFDVEEPPTTTVPDIDLPPLRPGCEWRTFTDGAGPAGRLPRALVRVGAGIVFIMYDLAAEAPVDFRWVGVSVPGKQTVPRAELGAYYRAVKALDAAGTPPSVGVTVDASYVVGGVVLDAAGVGKREASGNGDLWRLAYATSRRTALKCKSHLAPEDAAAGRTSALDLAGNALADAAAGAASLPSLPIASVKRAFAAARCSVLRCAWIEYQRIRALPVEVALPEEVTLPHEPNLQDDMAATVSRWEPSGHLAVSYGSHVGCPNCCRRIARSDVVLCRPFPPCGRPAPIVVGVAPPGLDSAQASLATPPADVGTFGEELPARMGTRKRRKELFAPKQGGRCRVRETPQGAARGSLRQAPGRHLSPFGVGGFHRVAGVVAYLAVLGGSALAARARPPLDPSAEPSGRWSLLRSVWRLCGRSPFDSVKR